MHVTTRLSEVYPFKSSLKTQLITVAFDDSSLIVDNKTVAQTDVI